MHTATHFGCVARRSQAVVDAISSPVRVGVGRTVRADRGTGGWRELAGGAFVTNGRAVGRGLERANFAGLKLAVGSTTETSVGEASRKQRGASGGIGVLGAALASVRRLSVFHLVFARSAVITCSSSRGGLVLAVYAR